MPRCGCGTRWRLAALAVAACVFGPARVAPAEEAAPGSAKAEVERREAENPARQVWLRALDERVQAWRRGGRFEEISAAVEDALARFPDEEAVTLVVEVVQKINSSNASLSEGPDRTRLNAWGLDLALRAVERLPRPASVYQHQRLVRRVLLSTMAAEAGHERSRILSAVVGLLRRWLDEVDPLWDPRSPHSTYPPVRPSDPRWHAGIGEKGPADEGEFRRVEEAWYAALLVREVQRDLRSVRSEMWLPSFFATLARLYPPEPDADRDLRAAAERVPEIDLLGLVEVARQSERRMQAETGSGLRFRLAREAGGSWLNSGIVGQGHPAVLVAVNYTQAPQVVPLALVRAALLYGDGPADQSVLPPRREARAEDLVVVEPGRHAELPLALPLPKDGLARVLVVLQNDQPRVGDREGVWTGAERFVELVDVAPSGESAGTHLRSFQEIARRAQVPIPQDLGDVTWMLEHLADAWPDDRSVEVLRVLAAGSKEPGTVSAALERLVGVVDRGCGASARFAFQAVAEDAARTYQQRVRAVEGLARFLAKRRRAKFDASPAVRVVVDEPADARVVADVRARLEALTRDGNHAVSAAARTALGQ